MKQFTRKAYDYNMHFIGVVEVINNGRWSDGHLAYIDVNDYQYAQIRHEGQLVLIRI